MTHIVTTPIPPKMRIISKEDSHIEECRERCVDFINTVYYNIIFEYLDPLKDPNDNDSNWENLDSKYFDFSVLPYDDVRKFNLYTDQYYLVGEYNGKLYIKYVDRWDFQKRLEEEGITWHT